MKRYDPHTILAKRLQGVTRCQIRHKKGSTVKMRPSVSWRMILHGRRLSDSWVNGENILWLRFGMGYFSPCKQERYLRATMPVHEFNTLGVKTWRFARMTFNWLTGIGVERIKLKYISMAPKPTSSSKAQY